MNSFIVVDLVFKKRNIVPALVFLNTFANKKYNSIVEALKDLNVCSKNIEYEAHGDCIEYTDIHYTTIKNYIPLFSGLANYLQNSNIHIHCPKNSYSIQVRDHTLYFDDIGIG